MLEKSLQCIVNADDCVPRKSVIEVSAWQPEPAAVYIHKFSLSRTHAIGIIGKTQCVYNTEITSRVHMRACTFLLRKPSSEPQICLLFHAPAQYNAAQIPLTYIQPTLIRNGSTLQFLIHDGSAVRFFSLPPLFQPY